MRYENLGPVSNPDGSPSDITRAMLAGTGRDPVQFVRASHADSETAIDRDARLNRWSDARYNANVDRERAYNRFVDVEFMDASDADVASFCIALNVFVPMDARSFINQITVTRR